MNVVITGTSSGLGMHLKRIFMANGHHVLGSTNVPAEEKGDERYLDLKEDMSIARYVEWVAENTVRIDLLINNAGINGIRKFRDLHSSFLEEMMRVNFIGQVMLIKGLMYQMEPNSSVINVTSDAAWRAMRHSLAYNCSKAAMDMATRQMARELTKERQMSFVAVRPGKMSGTEMSRYIDEQVCELREWTPEQAAEYAASASVTGLETPSEVMAGFIYNLATSGILKYASGSAMNLAG